MGLLRKGEPLRWEDSLKHLAYVKKHGILQFLHIYSTLKDRTRDEFLWGDEVEYLIIEANHKGKKVVLATVGGVLIKKFETIHKQIKSRDASFVPNVNFLPEYGRFMLEATPAVPYGKFTTDLILVEKNMRLRREMVNQLLSPSQQILSLSCFPMMGMGTFCDLDEKPGGPTCRSLYTPDGLMGEHKRFHALSRNIRIRRGSNVCIKQPLFQDVHTKEAVAKKLASAPAKFSSPLADETFDPYKEVHMDSMAFGMGCCCLQTTFQCRSLAEARFLYDSLAVLAPIMLAVTATTPFQHGKVCDTDVRWSTISQSVDDRTPCERGLREATEEEKQAGFGSSGKIKKSRYDSASLFLGGGPAFKAEYNDESIEIHEDSLQMLRKAGVDELLSRHIAHLFVRDPLVIYSGSIELDDKQSSDHFENIQSTNWQSVRFKPPPPDHPSMGWRVELRTMEVQLTDFENAAYSVFSALVSRTILAFGLNLYIPISKVDENMKRAHSRDAVNNAKFFWRKSLAPGGKEKVENEYEEATIKSIFLGKDGNPGLMSYLHAYLDMIKCDQETRQVVNRYLAFISQKADGSLFTTATWLRKFVSMHPDYKKDSCLSDSINYDIVQTCHQLSRGDVEAPQLHGDYLQHVLTDAEIVSRVKEGKLHDTEPPVLRGASFRLDFGDVEGPSTMGNFTKQLQEQLLVQKQSDLS